MTARLVGESKSKERFLFAFDVTEKTNKIKFKGQEIPIQIGFVYEKQGDKEIRYCNNSTASITGHDPYWDDPAMEFSPEEIERIVACPRCMGTMNRLPPRSWSGTANSSRTEPPQYGPSLVFGTSYFCTRSPGASRFTTGLEYPQGLNPLIPLVPHVSLGTGQGGSSVVILTTVGGRPLLPWPRGNRSQNGCGWGRAAPCGYGMTAAPSPCSPAPQIGTPGVGIIVIKEVRSWPRGDGLDSVVRRCQKG